MDGEARAAIEKLHRDTFQFAQETVGHGKKLKSALEGLSGVVEGNSAALEQQSVFIGGLEQRAHDWQEISQRELGKAHADMVELQGRVTAVESSVQDMQGWQQVERQAEFAAMVDKQLEEMEKRFSKKIEN